MLTKETKAQLLGEFFTLDYFTAQLKSLKTIEIKMNGTNTRIEISAIRKNVKLELKVLQNFILCSYFEVPANIVTALNEAGITIRKFSVEERKMNNLGKIQAEIKFGSDFEKCCNAIKILLKSANSAE